MRDQMSSLPKFKSQIHWHFNTWSRVIQFTIYLSWPAKLKMWTLTNVDHQMLTYLQLNQDSEPNVLPNKLVTCSSRSSHIVLRMDMGIFKQWPPNSMQIQVHYMPLIWICAMCKTCKCGIKPFKWTKKE